MNYPPSSNSGRQNGSALFLILIAVALFAALSYAMTQSSRSGGGSISREQTELKAARLMSYMGEIQAAVSRMVLSGVLPTALQFNTVLLNGVPCTSGASCVFAPDGGGVTFQDWPVFFQYANHNRLKFYPAGAGASVQGLGSASDEVLMLVTFPDGTSAQDAICDVINTKLGLPLKASQPMNSAFSSLTPPLTLDSLPGQVSGCIRDDNGTGAGSYSFYYVFYQR
jgi:hypothetical protein